METHQRAALFLLTGLMAQPALSAPPVADAKLWLTAEQGLVLDAGGGVERWEDQSGNGNHFEQPTAEKRPRVMAEAFSADEHLLVKHKRHQAGNATYSGTLGMDFVVEDEVVVTELAAFDSGRDGLAGTITIQLRQRNDGGTPFTREDDTQGAILEQLTFTPGDPGELDGPYRFKALAEARTLAPGSYTLLAWGYTTDNYYSADNVGLEPVGSGVRWAGATRYGTPAGEWPTNTNGASQYSGAMNLRFHAAGETPQFSPAVRFDGIDDGLHGVESMNFGRPSSVFVVFEGETTDTGYILQNTSTSNWWLRNDGYYAEGWVRNADFPWGRPQVAGMISTADETRSYLGYSDVTANANLKTAVPGRLALGGGSGQNNNPYEVKVAEVLVYDRQLSASEIWRTQAYLSGKYGIAPPVAETPAISPPGHLGEGDVEVTLATGTPGAEIRYTLDGSEPGPDSTLYAAPFDVARGTQVKARAYLDGHAASGVVSEFYGDADGNDVPVGGMLMWLRADRGVETDADGKVRAWKDLTGNGNDMLQRVAWQRPAPVTAFEQGGGVAIRSLYGNVGSNTHAGTLGTDFVVTEPIVISELGAFDHLGDGFAGSVTVQITTRDDAGTSESPNDDTGGTVLAEVEFTAAEPGALDGATRFKPIAPLTLQPGNYAILAWGFTGANQYRNSSDGWWLEDGLRFVGKSRYIGSNGAWPTTMDAHPVKYNGAGNFRFHKSGGSAVAREAVRFDGADDGLWSLSTSFIQRPSTVYLAFRRYDAGILLQNTSGGSWYVRQSGIYSDGWVRDRDFPIGATQIVGVSNGTSQTRAYVNGEDWTFNPNVGTVAPGRLALGGTSGQSNQPIEAEVAEVLAFDRELTEAERWQVEAYLAARYAPGNAVLPEVAISPSPNIGTGPVTVTLSNAAAEAEIRYTTDGSEPTEASPLYSAAFEVARGTTVRARAFAPGKRPTPVAEAYYGTSGVDDLPVAGATMWLRADRGIDRDAQGGISRWRDLTGNGNDVVQPAASQRPRVSADAFGSNAQTAIRIGDGDGNTTYSGTLGEDFVVSEPVSITHLGAFDHLKDGFSGTVTVQLWSRDDKGTPLTQTDDVPGELLAQKTFTSAEPGTPEGAMRWKALDAAVDLAPGAYTIYAWGYTGQNQYYEGDRGAFSSDRRFRFIGVSRYSGTAGAWPTNLDNRQLDYNGAANLKLAPPGPADAARPAVVFDGSNDALRGVETMNFARPSTVLVAFRRDRNESGYVLQSATANWWIRNDGFYTDGWVFNENFGIHRPYVAAMISGTSGTRAFLDGREVTGNANLSSPAPGRLVMGGANGNQNDPIPVSVAEMVVFDRALDAAEIWRMQAYLAERHEIYQPMVEAPTITPPGGYGTGDVEVTLATITAGAEIRYTLDGSEPQETSALYAGPFTISRGTTVRARAFLAGGAPSRVSEGFYGQQESHPLPVTDTAMWLRADRGVETNGDGTVARWRDLSGNGRDVVPTKPHKAPVLVSEAFAGAVQPVVKVPAGSTGGTTYAGAVGADFIVESPVEITHLGAFDHLGDGFSGTITVRLHRVDEKGTPVLTDDASAAVLATATFTNAAPGELDGGCRYLALAEPIALEPGRYLIESHGWAGGDSYNNSAASHWDETSGMGLTFPGVSRYGNATNLESLFPGSRHNDNRYLSAGTFKFRSSGDEAEPYSAVRFDGVDDGLLGPANYLVGRPSTVFLVFNHLNGPEGRLLQSGNGHNWLLGTHSSQDGMYADGWVAQHQIKANTPSLSIAVQEPGDSRYFHNGVDLTTNPNASGVLGRVALGGAEGTYNEPGSNELVELVVYDRVLAPGERQRVAAALAERYRLPLEPLAAPLASPDGGYFAAERTMSLSHPITGAEIRYTTDGSEPTESSPLYTTPIAISSSQTVKAKAFLGGYLPSPVEESRFIVDPAATNVPQRQAMQLWLRAGTGTELAEDKVAVWRDLSGRGMDARQTNADARPALGATAVGGAPGIVFDGSNDFLQMPEGFRDWSQGLTAIFVMRPESTGSWQRLIDLGRGPDNSNMLFARNGTSNSFTFGTNPHSVSAADSFLPATNASISVTLTPAGLAKIFVNGSLVSESTGFALPPTILRTLNYVARSNWSQDAYFSGAISEVILYNSVLGDLERETLETSIRQIYGIASSATGTVAFSPDASQLYPNGVDVTLSTVTPDAAIYYTLDGSAPSEASARYTAPIPLSASTRVRARAYAEGFNPSQFSEATYFIGQPPASGDGLLGNYYPSSDLSGTPVTRVDPQVNFAWVAGTPDPGIPADGFSVRWTGKVMPRFTEAYTFFTSTDDGARLWVDVNRDGVFDDATELLINDWTIHSETERTAAPVNLTAGQLYDIKLEYFENTSHATARLLWRSEFSEPKAVIPQSQLFSNAQFSQTVATPVISPAGGTYTSAVDVTISSGTSGATIYYTTDGSEPDTNAQVYGGPFNIGVDTVVRAKGYKAGFNPSGIATVSYDIDALPPQITSFTWNTVAIENGETFTAKGTLAATATDNQGIASAEFYYLPEGAITPILIGRDTSPAGGLTATWDVAGIQDGNYQVIVRVFDSSGIWSESTRDIAVALALLPAPEIVLPTSGISVQDPVVALKVQSVAGANIRLFRDNVFIFAGYANNSGVFEYLAPLPTGTSVFKAVAQNRAGASPASNSVTVSRVREFPQLGLSFDQNTVAEGAPITGTVSIPAATANPLIVEISTNKASQLETVAPVTIPAGATSATFSLIARQDTIIELLTTAQMTASAVEHKSRTVEIFVADDDYPEIALTLEASSVSEKHGNLVGTVSRAVATDRSLRVEISNSKPGEVTAPSHVDIPAGKTSTTFTLNVVDDTLNDGNQVAVLKGQVVVSGSVVATTPEVSLEVRDDEGPLLAIELAKPFVAEGSSINAILRRTGTANTSAVTVNLSADPTGQLTFPASVNIPAGQDQAGFAVSAPSGPETGSRPITLRASAASYTDGFATLTVSDASLPELAASALAAPDSAASETYASISYRVDNFGSAPTAGPFVERVFLSKDPSPSSDDALVRQVDMSGEVAAGGNYTRNVTILTPRQTGTYYVIVTVDAGNAISEIDEANNTTVLAKPFEVRAAYNATVQTDVDIVPANTPIVFHGSATKENGQPAGNSMVNIHIRLNGTTRVISAVTNSAGQFTTTWTPLRNEGGVYSIGATHPGSTGAPEQDGFEILTLGFDGPNAIVMNEGETVVTQAKLRNPNARPLTGLSIETGELPEGLTISPQLPATTLAAGAEMTVPISVSAASAFAGNGSFTLAADTAEGVTMQASMNVRIELLKPVLTLDPGSLGASVLRGTSRTASFVITNTGGLETGDIEVLLPDLPWLTVASANPIESLEPGESAAVSVVLAPGVNVPLTEFTGSLALNPENGTGKAVPYRFRVVSDMKGDLEIEVQDELTFFTAEAPRLAGAKVTVRDAISSVQVATLTTPESGVVTFPGLNEGWYRVEVTAPDHDSFSNNYYINAGQTNRHEVFVSKRLVKYSWKVEEIEIQDVYQVKVEATFETNVPAPVVTATPGTFDVSDLIALGQSKTINVTLENHGFIAAQESAFRFSEHPFYQFTPLVTNIGTIPAKSSLVVPVQITRVGVFGDDGGIVTLESGERGLVTARGVERKANVPCSAAGAVDYNYPCGPHLVSRAVQLAINGVQGGCGGTSNPNAGQEFIIELNRFYGERPGGNSGREGGLEPTGGLLGFESLDPCTALCLSRAALDCVVGFGPTPLACAYAGANCAASNGDALTCAGAGLCWAGPAVNAGFCVLGTINCFMPFSGPIGGSGLAPDDDPGGYAPKDFAARTAAVGFIFPPAAREFDLRTAAAWANVEPALEMQALILGSKERVLMQSQPGMEEMMAAMRAAAVPSSADGAVINAAEIAELQTEAAAAGLSWDLFSPIVARLNRTVDYNTRGIYNPEDVPEGESLDFIPRDELQFLAQQVIEAQEKSQAQGFVDPFHEFTVRSDELREELTGGQGGTCAKVKIQLSQDVMMTRTAFRATLELENERDEELTAVGFDLKVRDEQGQPAEDLFNIQITQLTGLEAADGTGEIGAQGKGTVQWTLIPRDTAALEIATRYTVGGTIHYVQSGTEFNIPVSNVPITVRPDAALSLKYFHQRDVFSDDPHTDAIEPSIPYKLAVMVENNGHGDARNLKIISGQPEIVDNEKGLFIDFKIIGTEVDGQSLSPSLTADFGNVAPGQRKIATWLMTSTLQGLFLDYTATFEHVSGLGDKRLSLLQNVEIHEMIRMVRDQRPGADSAPDFLVNDVVDANDYPDTIHYSNGGTDLVTLKQSGNFTGTLSPQNLTLTLDVGAFTGWSYIRLPDPGNGKYRLVSVVRSDSRTLPIDFNAWQTDRTFIGGGRRPRYENILHLADSDSTGVYTLTYAPAAAADIVPPSSLVKAMPALSPAEIPVFWSGTDNVGVANFDVFASVNGGPFALWKEKTTATGAIFSGQPGATYAFYSIARDNAGNVEAKAAAAEASTEVGVANQPPVLAAISAQSVNEGSVFTYKATATDADGPAGDIRYSLAEKPAGMVINALTGVISWPTGETDGGRTVTVTVAATDSAAVPGVATRTFPLSVIDVNSAPAITALGPQTVQAGGVLIADLDASDGDLPAQTLTFSLVTAPAGAAIDPASGVVTWSPTAEQAGSHGFTVRVSDNGTPARFAETSFAVNVVAPTNRPPQFTKVPVVLWTKGQTYTLMVSATDPDGDAITLAANVSSAPGASFADQGGGNGQLAWNLATTDSGTYNIPVTATANGSTVNATIKIRVAENDLYWTWVKETFGDLPVGFDLSQIELDADPDGDGRGNVHEMALLTNPLAKDSVPVEMSVEMEDPFGSIRLRTHRRKGSDVFVNLGLERSGSLTGDWQNVPAVDWNATIDANGDDDGKPHTESVDFELFEFYPDGIPSKRFYRLESSRK